MVTGYQEVCTVIIILIRQYRLWLQADYNFMYLSCLLVYVTCGIISPGGQMRRGMCYGDDLCAAVRNATLHCTIFLRCS